MVDCSVFRMVGMSAFGLLGSPSVRVRISKYLNASEKSVWAMRLRQQTAWIQRVTCGTPVAFRAYWLQAQALGETLCMWSGSKAAKLGCTSSCVVGSGVLYDWCELNICA